MKDLDIYFLLGNIKNIKRSWCTLGFKNAQNVAEHSYRMALLGYFLAKKLNANVERVILISLLHDVPELLCGDLNNIQTKYVTRDETKAFHKIFARHPELLELYREYKEGITLESKIVRDVDALEALLEINENYWQNREFFDKFLNKPNAKLDNLNFPETKQLFSDIFAEVSKPLDWTCYV